MSPHRPLPVTRDLVLIGGGHTHALVLRRWGMAPVQGVRLTLIHPMPTAAYSGMLPGHVAGHYGREALDIDIIKAARFAGARLILDRVTGLDLEGRTVLLAGQGPGRRRLPVPFDVASLNVGITTALSVVPGAATHTIPAKPLDAFASAWEAFVQDVAVGAKPPTVAVVGGGVSGCELAMAMSHRLRHVAPAPAVRCTLLEGAPHLLPQGPEAVRRHLARPLHTLGVTVKTGRAVEAFQEGSVLLEGGEPVDAAFIVTVTGAKPLAWLAETGLDLDQGFIRVRQTLQTQTDPMVFAAGDCAALPDPRPKAGVFAVREAPVLHGNLEAVLTGGRLRPYRPQRDYLKLVSLGGKRAVAEKGGRTLAGDWVWRWKNWIDQRFMDKFRQLPAMAAPPAPRGPRALETDSFITGQQPCQGCGAKVGPLALRQALSALPSPVGEGLERPPGDDAGLIRWPDGRWQVISHDHLPAFIADPWLMGRIAAVHALGDVWAMGAEPQAMLAALVIPRSSEGLQARTVAEILDGAQSVAGSAGASLLGGHTTQGDTLTVGFTVTGLTPRPIGLAGAQPGDALVLTKPLGVGVILAAEMRLAAPGATVRGAWAQMADDSTAQAAAQLAAVAHAMTDVTGFGLAGHLIGMLAASGGLSARLDLECIPTLPGSVDLARAGIESTLAPANRAAVGDLAALGVDPKDPRAALLVDPQTAGGLLAAVPPDRVPPGMVPIGTVGEPVSAGG